MTKQKHRVVRLTRRALIGLRDMPANAIWVAGRARRSSSSALSRATDAMGDAGSAVGGAISDAGRSVVDVVPHVGSRNDSVEALLSNARRASDEARRTEERALTQAENAEAGRRRSQAHHGSRPPTGKGGGARGQVSGRSSGR